MSMSYVTLESGSMGTPDVMSSLPQFTNLGLAPVPDCLLSKSGVVVGQA